nr:MAG TPA: hypothetical protein [Caudoviricetes sp.]
MHNNINIDRCYKYGYCSKLQYKLCKFMIRR